MNYLHSLLARRLYIVLGLLLLSIAGVLGILLVATMTFSAAWFTVMLIGICGYEALNEAVKESPERG